MLCFLSGCTKEPAYSSVTKEQYEAAFTPANNFTQVIESTITSDNAATLTMNFVYQFPKLIPISRIIIAAVYSLRRRD